jgi:hypothetical protein
MKWWHWLLLAIVLGAGFVIGRKLVTHFWRDKNAPPATGA